MWRHQYGWCLVYFDQGLLCRAHSPFELSVHCARRQMDTDASANKDTIQHDPIDVEGWYSTLCEYTFKTEFVDLTESQAQAICKAYDSYGKIMDEKFKTNLSEEEDAELKKVRQFTIVAIFNYVFYTRKEIA
jgi:hypothetical protein